ncbi:MAG: 6-hydroxynicotinate reductase [Rhodospirillales bacterium]|jgi:6-hydroxynicotinate reductase|nr:6-hydroxynicotinate reductase [Rhodospirillales bacterium]
MSEAPQEKIRCDACPVLCFIAEGKSGACDRYANNKGNLRRVDPLVVLEHQDTEKADFPTAVGAGTTYPDYKPAPFIVSSDVDGVDMITVVTEAIYSYCGAKIKIDTDSHIGSETSPVRFDGEQVGHVTTGEYGSQMLSLGGVHHLTGGSKREGRMTCDAIMHLCNKEPVELTVDDGASVIVEAGKAPIINGALEERMRVGCGSATIGMFAKQWYDHVDEVVVVDDHITGVLSEHQAGKLLGVQPSGIHIKGRRSTPGRYFQVANPGTGWGGTDIEDPLSILGDFNPKNAKPGTTMLLVSTTGEHSAYFILDDDLKPIEQDLPPALQASVKRIRENCEPAMCSVMFIGGAGGSLRAGVTENPVKLTRSVRDALTYVSAGGAPVFIWPGGGITFMVDVTLMPENSFGYVPTPALVAPIEFTMSKHDYQALGGFMDAVIPLEDVMERTKNDQVKLVHNVELPWPWKGDKLS